MASKLSTLISNEILLCIRMSKWIFFNDLFHYYFRWRIFTRKFARFWKALKILWRVIFVIAHPNRDLFGLGAWKIMNFVWIVLQSLVSEDAFFALFGKFLTTIARSWRIYPCWPLNNLKLNDSNQNCQSLHWSIKSVKMQSMDVKSKHQSSNMFVTSTLWT